MSSNSNLKSIGEAILKEAVSKALKIKIKDSSITTSKIQDFAVTRDKLSQDLRDNIYTSEALIMLAKAYTSEATAEALAMLTDYNQKTANAVAASAEALLIANNALEDSATAITDSAKALEEASAAAVSAKNAETSASNSAKSADASRRYSRNSSISADEAKEYLALLIEAVKKLPDGQSVSMQVAENKADITVLKAKVSDTKKLVTLTESVWDSLQEDADALEAFCAKYDGYALDVIEDNTSIWLFGDTFPIKFSASEDWVFGSTFPIIFN